MFKDIEKTYIKNCGWRTFSRYYWSVCFISSLILYNNNIFSSFSLITYMLGIIFTFILIYFCIHYIKIYKKVKRKKHDEFNFHVFTYQVKEMRIEALLKMLNKYNFKTKEDLKMAIDYYTFQKPIHVKSNSLDWISSISISLLSLFEIGYDNTKKVIDFSKLNVLINETASAVCIVLILIFIIKSIFKNIFLKEEIISNLNDDLCYIYLNFNKYKNQLTKKK